MVPLNARKAILALSGISSESIISACENEYRNSSATPCERNVWDCCSTQKKWKTILRNYSVTENKRIINKSDNAWRGKNGKTLLLLTLADSSRGKIALVYIKKNKC